jgi:2-polyprenyl-3-methyl-5-hydroxy-6-metoxy-1,4-benzoquinol methylase
MWQKKRCGDLEILDLGPTHYTKDEYTHCLKLLGRINQWLGGFKATKKAFLHLKKMPRSILEVGCGGGHLCHQMSQWFPQAQITGIDINSAAVDEARRFNSSNKNVHCEKQQNKTLPYADNQFDVVTTMLVCHHMNDQELVEFLKECYRICRSAVIINDLHRHILAYTSFLLITPIFFPNRLIWNDGCLSVRRAFRKSEWLEALTQAGFREDQYELRWNWAFRWTLTIKKYAN